MELFASLLILTAPVADAPPAAPVAPVPVIERVLDPRVVDLGELDALRGGDGGITAVITDQTLTAINSGNSLNAQTIGSGDINLGAGAFAGFAGIGNFAVNSGHNNNLQANVSISINLTPAVGP